MTSKPRIRVSVVAACACLALGAPPAGGHEEDPACAVAHGATAPAVDSRTLIAVFASPVAGYLLRYGADLGFRGILLEPDAERASAARVPGAEIVPHLVLEGLAGERPTP